MVGVLNIDKVDIYVSVDDITFGSKPKRMNRNFISSKTGEKTDFTGVYPPL